jgi:transposase
MQVLTDAQWAKFEAAIAAANIRGARPRTEDRRTIEAIIWRLDNGAKWRSIPAELGDWHHAYLRFRRWAVRGVWDTIMSHVVAQGEPAGFRLHRRHDRTGPSKGLGCQCEQICQMSPRFNRNIATQGEALGRSRGGLGTKIVGVCDAAGRARRFSSGPRSSARTCTIAHPVEASA